MSLDDKELAINKDLHELLNVCDPREEIVVDKPVQSEQEAKSVRDRDPEGSPQGDGEGGGHLPSACPTCAPARRSVIGGIGARFSGTYFVTDTTHTINDSGYITKFNARREVTGSLQGLE